MTDDQYVSGRELWNMIQEGHHTHDSAYLTWRVDKYADKGELTAFSRVPQCSYGIGYVPANKPEHRWVARHVRQLDTTWANYPTLGEAMQAVDAMEADEIATMGKL